MSTNENRANYSLTAFSNFITAASVIGGISLIAGVIFLNSGSIVNPQLWLVGAGLCYLGGTGLALACGGWFLRQTALVIVEGMGGVIDEATSGPTGVEDYSLDKRSREILSKLTRPEVRAYTEAGSPDLSTWTDPDELFLTWLSRQK